MGLQIERRVELKGVDGEILRSSERRYTRAALLALAETEVCKQLSPVGFDAVSLGLSEFEAGEIVDSWEQLADSPMNLSERTDSDSLCELPKSSREISPPVNISGRTESNSILGAIERPNSRHRILDNSGRTESDSLLGPFERPNSRNGILPLPPVDNSGRMESDSLLGPFELPNSRNGILPLADTSGRMERPSLLLGPIQRPKSRNGILPLVDTSDRMERPSLLLGPIQRPKSRNGIPPPASICGSALLPPPCALQVPPGFCAFSENPSSPKWEINSNTDAPQLKADVLYQSVQETLETGFRLLSKSANPYRPPHCREAQVQLDAKVESDAVCSPKLQIGEMEIQSGNLEAWEHISNLVSSPSQAASDDSPNRVYGSRPCEPPFVDASTPRTDISTSSSSINQTGVVFGDVEEFAGLTELHDMKVDELDFEDVWTEVSAKMWFEQEMELKRGTKHDDNIAGSEDNLPNDNCDDSDAIISLPEEDSLISIDDMLKLGISILKDENDVKENTSVKEENNSVKEEDTTKPKPKGSANRRILEDIDRFKRRSGLTLPSPLLLPHQLYHRYQCPSTGAASLVTPSPPLTSGATARVTSSPPLSYSAAVRGTSPPSSYSAAVQVTSPSSSGGATVRVTSPPSSGGATVRVTSPPSRGSATVRVTSSPPSNGGTTAFIPPPPLPSSSGATALIRPALPPPPPPFNRGTGAFFIPAPLPWGYRPTIMAPVYAHYLPSFQ